jgi:hypothetical protein
MRRRILARGGATLALVAATVAGGTGAVPAHADDDSKIIINKLSQKCLTARDGNNSTVTQWDCNSGDNLQRWSLVGNDDQLRIINMATQRCLAVFGTDNAQLVYAAPCDMAGAMTTWTKNRKGDQYTELRSFDTNKCLDLHADSRANGAVIQQWGCNWGDNANQTWLIL